MKQHHETEIKLEVRDPKMLRRRLRELGFACREARHFESNHLFDFPDLRLRKARCLLRLRFANGRGIVTFKGAPLPTRGYKIRREIEAEVEHGDQLREILECLGLREMFRYEKYRSVYVQGNRRKKAGTPLLLYDETPIGNFLELEGPTRWIDRVARQLGYTREEYIPASYGELYRRYCLAGGLEPGNMVFSARKS